MSLINRFYRRLIIILVVSLFSSVLSANENRTWSDSTGRFKVEAKFVRMEGDKVVIKKADGKFQTIPLDKLSKEDQDYVAGLNAENPFAGGTDEPAENPFAGGNNSDKTSSSRSKTDLEDRKKEIERRMAESRSSSRPDSTNRRSSRFGNEKKFDGFDMPQGDAFDSDPKTVDAGGAIEGGGSVDTIWNCEADSVELGRMEEKPRNLSFSLGELPLGVWPKEAGLALFSQDGKPKVLYATAVDMERNEADSKTIIIIGEPLFGKMDRMQFDQKVRLFGISPDGNKALFREEAWGFANDRGKQNFVHIVKIDGTVLRKQSCYYPFAEDSKSDRSFDWDIDVEWGDWIDNEHVMLISHKKKLIVLNVDSGKIVWRLSDAGTNKAIFSAGRKYCLLPSHNGAVMLETKSGKPIGKLDRSNSLMLRFAFSPDGKTIAGFGNDGVQLWNATTGEMDEPFYIGESFGKLAWANNRFLMIGGNLVDIRSKSSVWTYSPFADENVFFDGYYWFLSGHGKEKRLGAVVIPHGKALIASQAPESKRFCVRPGMEVALMVDNSIQTGRNEIIRRIQDVLKENELVLKNSAPITVHLKVRQEDEATIQYVTGSRFGAPPPLFHRGGGTDIKYRPCKFSVDFQKDGKTLWSVSKTTSSPTNIPLDELQKDSLQNVVNKAMEKANADYKDWFMKVKIPKRIPNTEGGGNSTLGIDGIRDQTDTTPNSPFPRPRKL